VPLESELLFQCSGSRETVCSAATGGVITSGGGFSNVNQRADTVRTRWNTFVAIYCHITVRNCSELTLLFL
jgi:hypothetical protein